MLKKYYQLTKPGIIYGNVFTTLAGFLFASRWHFSFLLLLATLFGIAFVIASACVFNNYIDRDIDKKMTRTKDRALVSGIIPAWSALLYAAVLGVLGFYLLYAQVNSLTALIALVGFIFYIVLYAIAKRASHWGTVVGSVSGAVPIVVGYTAITDRIDTAAIILFSTLVLWQMPHFYAIATYRLDEYVAAGIPVLPAKKGMRTTKLYIVGYIIAFIIAMSLLTVFGYTGYSYLIVVSLVGLVWLWYGIRGFKVSNDALWARKTFLFSLIMLVVFSVMVSVGALLP